MKARRKFTKEFKQTAVRRLNSGQNMAEVARALEVHPSDLHHLLSGTDLATNTRFNRRTRRMLAELRQKINDLAAKLRDQLDEIEPRAREAAERLKENEELYV